MYTIEFKQAAVQKAELRGSRPLSEVASELGVSPWTLQHWRKRASMGAMGRKTGQGKRSLEDKLNILFKTAAMAEKDLGEFLRREGLHAADLERWKAEINEHMRGPSRSERAEENKLRFEKARLEKKLRRNEKALAETAALLVLKKKADLLFGTVDDEDEE